MNTKRLPTLFSAIGFENSILERAGSVALVRRTEIKTGSVHWETWVIKTGPPHPMSTSTESDQVESPPSNADWGTKGFTHMSFFYASRQFKKLLDAQESKRQSKIKEGLKP
jgi:hypothetical protein